MSDIKVTSNTASGASSPLPEQFVLDFAQKLSVNTGTDAQKIADIASWLATLPEDQKKVLTDFLDSETDFVGRDLFLAALDEPSVTTTTTAAAGSPASLYGASPKTTAAPQTLSSEPPAVTTPPSTAASTTVKTEPSQLQTDVDIIASSSLTEKEKTIKLALLAAKSGGDVTGFLTGTLKTSYDAFASELKKLTSNSGGDPVGSWISYVNSFAATDSVLKYKLTSDEEALKNLKVVPASVKALLTRTSSDALAIDRIIAKWGTEAEIAKAIGDFVISQVPSGSKDELAYLNGDLKTILGPGRTALWQAACLSRAEWTKEGALLLMAAETAQASKLSPEGRLAAIDAAKAKAKATLDIASSMVSNSGRADYQDWILKAQNQMGDVFLSQALNAGGPLFDTLLTIESLRTQGFYMLDGKIYGYPANGGASTHVTPDQVARYLNPTGITPQDADEVRKRGTYMAALFLEQLQKTNREGATWPESYYLIPAKEALQALIATEGALPATLKSKIQAVLDAKPADTAAAYADPNVRVLVDAAIKQSRTALNLMIVTDLQKVDNAAKASNSTDVGDNDAWFHVALNQIQEAMQEIKAMSAAGASSTDIYNYWSGHVVTTFDRLNEDRIDIVDPRLRELVETFIASNQDKIGSQKFTWDDKNKRMAGSSVGGGRAPEAMAARVAKLKEFDPASMNSVVAAALETVQNQILGPNVFLPLDSLSKLVTIGSDGKLQFAPDLAAKFQAVFDKLTALLEMKDDSGAFVTDKATRDSINKLFNDPWNPISLSDGRTLKDLFSQTPPDESSLKSWLSQRLQKSNNVIIPNSDTNFGFLLNQLAEKYSGPLRALTNAEHAAYNDIEVNPIGSIVRFITISDAVGNFALAHLNKNLENANELINDVSSLISLQSQGQSRLVVYLKFPLNLSGPMDSETVGKIWDPNLNEGQGGFVEGAKRPQPAWNRDANGNKIEYKDATKNETLTYEMYQKALAAGAKKRANYEDFAAKLAQPQKDVDWYGGDYASLWGLAAGSKTNICFDENLIINPDGSGSYGDTTFGANERRAKLYAGLHKGIAWEDQWMVSIPKIVDLDPSGLSGQSKRVTSFGDLVKDSMGVSGAAVPFKPGRIIDTTDAATMTALGDLWLENQFAIGSNTSIKALGEVQAFVDTVKKNAQGQLDIYTKLKEQLEAINPRKANGTTYSFEMSSLKNANLSGSDSQQVTFSTSDGTGGSYYAWWNSRMQDLDKFIAQATGVLKTCNETDIAKMSPKVINSLSAAEDLMLKNTESITAKTEPAITVSYQYDTYKNPNNKTRHTSEFRETYPDKAWPDGLYADNGTRHKEENALSVWDYPAFGAGRSTFEAGPNTSSFWNDTVYYNGEHNTPRFIKTKPDEAKGQNGERLYMTFDKYGNIKKVYSPSTKEANTEVYPLSDPIRSLLNGTKKVPARTSLPDTAKLSDNERQRMSDVAATADLATDLKATLEDIKARIANPAIDDATRKAGQMVLDDAAGLMKIFEKTMTVNGKTMTGSEVFAAYKAASDTVKAMRAAMAGDIKFIQNTGDGSQGKFLENVNKSIKDAVGGLTNAVTRFNALQNVTDDQVIDGFHNDLYGSEANVGIFPVYYKDKGVFTRTLDENGAYQGIFVPIDEWNKPTIDISKCTSINGSTLNTGATVLAEPRSKLNSDGTIQSYPSAGALYRARIGIARTNYENLQRQFNDMSDLAPDVKAALKKEVDIAKSALDVLEATSAASRDANDLLAFFSNKQFSGTVFGNPVSASGKNLQECIDAFDANGSTAGLFAIAIDYNEGFGVDAPIDMALILEAGREGGNGKPLRDALAQLLGAAQTAVAAEPPLTMPTITLEDGSVLNFAKLEHSIGVTVPDADQRKYLLAARNAIAKLEAPISPLLIDLYAAAKKQTVMQLAAFDQVAKARKNLSDVEAKVPESDVKSAVANVLGQDLTTLYERQNTHLTTGGNGLSGLASLSGFTDEIRFPIYTGQPATVLSEPQRKLAEAHDTLAAYYKLVDELKDPISSYLTPTTSGSGAAGASVAQTNQTLTNLQQFTTVLTNLSQEEQNRVNQQISINKGLNWETFSAIYKILTDITNSLLRKVFQQGA